MMIRLFSSLVALVLFVGCGSDPVQQPPIEGTRIEAGIYTGTVECEFTRIVATQGVVENYVYDFNETFVFNDIGLPEPGAAFNPDDDKIEIFGSVFTVTNRTFDITDLGTVENAVLVGVVEGDRVNGLLTWTFLYESEDSLRYQLDISWTSATAGIAWSITEDCSGILTK